MGAPIKLLLEKKIRVSFGLLYMTEHLGKQPDNGNLYQ